MKTTNKNASKAKAPKKTRAKGKGKPKRGKPTEGAEKRPVGRPPKYATPEEMQVVIDDYFRVCDDGEICEVVTTKGFVEKVTRKIPYTVPGLAYHLGFNSRDAVWEYGKRAAFSDTIKRATMRIQAQRNTQALRGDVNPKFAAFDLNVNFGWTEKKTLDLTGSVEEKLSDEDRATLKEVAKALARKARRK